jgi:DNA polymerase
VSEPNPPTPEDLARQARQHLDSLRAAGVEYLPAARGPVAVPQQTTVAEAGPVLAPAVQVPLFQQTLPAEETLDGSAPEQRRHELELLAGRVAACTRCAELAGTRTQTVFGVGPVDAELCFIGEAPGATEDAQGEPFVGDAGKLLNRIIVACGMKREEVYICNIIRCRPPGNRLPLAHEAGNCREYLERQLELVRPKFICALGACAAQNLLGSTLSIGKLRGRFHDYRGIPVLCTYHPAFLLRSPEKKKDVWEDMKKLLARMGRSVPPSGNR